MGRIYIAVGVKEGFPSLITLLLILCRALRRLAHIITITILLTRVFRIVVIFVLRDVHLVSLAAFGSIAHAILILREH